MAVAADLTDLIAPVAAAQGLAMVRVQLSGQPATLQVMAEDPATGQLTLAQCERLSRAVSAVLDEADPIEHDYTLEVSSPGIDRPLTRPADFVRWTGHEVRLKLVPPVGGRARLYGVLAAAAAGQVVVDVPSVGPVSVPLAQVEGAKLVLTDRLIAATRPLDSTGADELDDVSATSDED